jgi:hypothetical protein
MKPAVALLILLVAPAAAHRLDEYLQASLISLSRARVHLQLDLTPGVAVLPQVLSAIDTDRDGTISETERNAYATQVLRDLSLVVDGEPARLQLVSSLFPKIEEMNEGLGVIRLELDAELPPSRSGASRRISFENHHQDRISAYLVNSLVPRDPALRITAQSRDYRQSAYRVDFVQSGGAPWCVVAAACLLLVRAAIFWRRGPAVARTPRAKCDPGVAC